MCPIHKTRKKNRPLLSYKDKLMGFNGESSSEMKDEQIEIVTLKSNDEVLEANLAESDQKEEDPTCLIIQITKEERRELCKP